MGLCIKLFLCEKKVDLFAFFRHWFLRKWTNSMQKIHGVNTHSQSQLHGPFRQSSEKLGIDFDLKEKQIEILKALYTGKDCVGILPTGYCKSLICQHLPYFLQRKFGSSQPKLVLTVCPLNSLMEDQCMALRKKGLRVCMLNTEGTKGLSYKLDNSSSDDEDEGMIRIYGITLLILWSFSLCVSLCFVTICIVYDCSMK